MNPQAQHSSPSVSLAKRSGHRTPQHPKDRFSPEDRARLDRSLRTWTRRFGSRALARLIEIAERVSGRDVVLEIAARMYRRQFGHHLDTMMEACTNDFERLLVEPLMLVSQETADTVSYYVGGAEGGEITHPQRTHICIEPQAELGPYRVDFRLEWRTSTFLRRDPRFA